MKTVKIITFIGLMTILTAAYSQPYGNGRGDRTNQHEPRTQGPVGLDLSDEQQAKAETLRLNMQKAALPIRNQLGENKAKMRTLTTAENPDMKAINQLIDKNADLNAELAKLRAANHQEFRKMLTEEQRIKFDNRSQTRFHRNGQRSGDRSQRGQFRQHRHFKGQSE